MSSHFSVILELVCYRDGQKNNCKKRPHENAAKHNSARHQWGRTKSLLRPREYIRQHDPCWYQNSLHQTHWPHRWWIEWNWFFFLVTSFCKTHHCSLCPRPIKGVDIESINDEEARVCINRESRNQRTFRLTINLSYFNWVLLSRIPPDKTLYWRSWAAGSCFFEGKILSNSVKIDMLQFIWTGAMNVTFQ